MQTDIKCSYCGNDLSDRILRLRNPYQKLFFCNKQCQGKFIGTNFGYKKGEVHSVRQYDHDEIAHLYKSMTAKEVSNITGIYPNYVHTIAKENGIYKNKRRNVSKGGN